jgi:uncharacterized protein (TIGR03437 family)
VDGIGNLYIADKDSERVREVSGGVIITVAGGGRNQLGGNIPATSALLSPAGVAVDSAGNLYIADYLNNVIRRVSDGVISIVAGNGFFGFAGDNGPATSSQLNDPLGVAVDAAGNVYIADSYNARIREVSEGVIATVAGNGSPYGFSGDGDPATSAQLNSPAGVAVDSVGDVYIADTANNRIRKVSNGVITTVAGNGIAGFSGDNGPATSAELNLPSGIAVDSAGNLYIYDTYNSRIRKVSNGVIATVAGGGTGGLGANGPATSAQLGLNSGYCPIVCTGGIAVDSADDLYIADTGNNRIRRVSMGVISTIAGLGGGFFSGDNGPATNAGLNEPTGIAVDSAGNLYIADSGNNRVRKVLGGVITTVAGNGNYGFSGDGGSATSAQLSLPEGVAVDSTGDFYIVDSHNVRIRKVSNGLITTVAGSGTQGFGGDNGPAVNAQLNPWDVAVDSAGNVYVADGINNRVRVLTPSTVPAITKNGIVPVYSPVPVIQPGSWISIYGSNLANGTYLWNGDFPKSLGGTSVMIDNTPAYLWSVSPTQINLQVPDDTTTGLVSVAVTTASGTSASTVTLAQYGPSFSLLGDGKHAVGEIATPNGTGAYGGGTYDLVGPSGTFSFNTRPVNPGETLTLYGVGFGPTTPHVPAGQAFSGTAPTNTPVTITIGSVNANVSFAGITEAGLYQFNLTVPPNTGSGDQPLQATVNGVQSPAGPVVTVQ